LSLASGGANKLAAILLGISEHAGGIVFVDEIENGFYYKKMPMIWRILLDFAETFNCQIFASTHSLECLQAIAKLAESKSDKFCMLRTVASNSGTVIRYFDGDKFSSAVLDDIEVR
jgi:AAA15 family ATPase/GTPase